MLFHVTTLFINSEQYRIKLYGIMIINDVTAPGVIEQRNIDCPRCVKAWRKKVNVTIMNI